MNTKDDIVMKEANDEVKQITEKIDNVNLQAKPSMIYSEYKKTILNIEKSLSIKDSKSLLQNFKQINRYRKGFNEDDISFICDVYLRAKYSFKAIPSCEQKIKVITILALLMKLILI